MGISRQLQQRTTPTRPEVGYTPTWQDFPEGVMSAIMQGMVECRFVDLDGNVFEYRWKPINEAPILTITDDARRDSPA